MFDFVPPLIKKKKRKEKKYYSLISYTLSYKMSCIWQKTFCKKIIPKKKYFHGAVPVKRDRKEDY